MNAFYFSSLPQRLMVTFNLFHIPLVHVLHGDKQKPISLFKAPKYILHLSAHYIASLSVPLKAFCYFLSMYIR